MLQLSTQTLHRDKATDESVNICGYSINSLSLKKISGFGGLTYCTHFSQCWMKMSNVRFTEKVTLSILYIPRISVLMSVQFFIVGPACVNHLLVRAFFPDVSNTPIRYLYVPFISGGYVMYIVLKSKAIPELKIICIVLCIPSSNSVYSGIPRIEDSVTQSGNHSFSSTVSYPFQSVPSTMG